MNKNLQEDFSVQLDNLSAEHQQYCSRSQHNDASDVISKVKAHQMMTRCLASIERVVGKSSVYYEQALAALQEIDHDYGHLMSLVGIVESLSLDIKSGYLKTLEELIHADIFGDFLEMADYLVSNGYKDAAAVIAGSTLEAHLKQLSDKGGIATHQNEKPKPADLINSELAKAQVYSPLDQKNVTAWFGLRNNAAHGNYQEYDKKQVDLLIAGIRDFITRNPA